ncbi:MAG: M55 family metallopeptidase [Desulfobacterales bacterium]|jgi:D-aminopeptidase
MLRWSPIMTTMVDSVLIIADIEGSSGCWSYRASAFKTNEWVAACVEMTRDVAAVVRALFDNGMHRVTVKDFHRTGFNLLPEMIDSRARVVQGYKIGPVPGIGDPGSAEAALFIGMHAASGSNGFMAHTLTSRIRRLETNGELLPEVYLFAGSLAPYGVKPVFFAGCPVACDQARVTIPGIHTYSIDKSVGRQEFAAEPWRQGLARAATSALHDAQTVPFDPPGPFHTKVTLREGGLAAQKLSARWGFRRQGADIILHNTRLGDLYLDLIRICYLTPMAERLLPLAVAASNLRGRAGLAWLRRRLYNRFK